MKGGRKIDKKYIGYALVIVGIVSLLLGTLDTLGYVNLQMTMIDTTPPKIFYCYPASNLTYKTSELDEFVLYAYDDSEVTFAMYSDNYQTISLVVTPYTQLKHPMIIAGIKFPDVNFDGRVNKTDADLICSAFGAILGDPNYNPTYDLNSDNIIDGTDATIAFYYVGTVVFSSTNKYSYPLGVKVQYSFSAVNSYSYATAVSGEFSVADYELLLGQWFINEIPINATGTAMDATNNAITVKFVKNDTTISDTLVSASVTVKDTTILLDYNGNSVWSKQIIISTGQNTLVLKAIAGTYRNEVSATVTLPSSQFTVGHALIFSGLLCISVGIVIITRKEESAYY